MPVQAVTEAIVNAVVHRDYASTGSVQVMLFKDRLEVWNPGRLPQGITVVNLSQEHRSIPVNPILARPVYLAGYIEQLGTGTTDLIKRCQDLGLRRPEFRQDENFLSILWRKNAGKDDATVHETVHEIGHETGHEKTTIRRIVMAIGRQMLTRKDIMEKLSLKGRDNFRKGYLEPSMLGGYVAQLYPSSAKRRDQAYYLTQKGLEFFASLKNDK